MKFSFILLFCFLPLACSVFAQSRLISATPQDGKGKQIAGIYACNGQTKAEEGVFNLLYNASEGSGSKKKWCNNDRVYPWVIFELTDIYAIDKIVFRDVKPYESNFANVPEYWVYVSTESAENCSWMEVAHQTGQGAVNVKEITFDPAEARFVKIVFSHGTLSNGSRDGAIRIYGMDIYGQFIRSIEREAVSGGKTVMAFNGTSAYYERPLHTLDGIFTNVNNRWKFSRPILSDSLTYMIIDLEQQYTVSRFKLYDSQYLEAGYPNIRGYNIYLSESAPDLFLIGKNKDNNTCWTKVVNAYDENRSEQSVKTDDITPVPARYVKLEIPRSCTTGDSRIFQFEVFGENAGLAIAPVESLSESVYPNPVKRGENINISGQGLLKIYSAQGNIIESRVLHSETNSISTANLSSGVYLLHFNTKIVKLIIK